ncbi:MAG TPA: alcohol dehydrogenase catalytic domain-containing protein [Acidimicrobiales bacterium]|jgi:2-desacetyl-2-hydroxyethyl bacteriochlorophyllide A dehydrogenase|nr:alcohol dehydrogenase catalytic domain-containing protein [Acidimicrobiales bacterium]
MTTTLPSTMPAVILNGKDDLSVEDVPVPEVGPDEVLVEVSHCGVCGSDLHMVIDGWGRKGSIEGHEWSGVVVAVGDAVSTWSVGDEIVGGPSPRCGECEPCRKGHPSLCSQRGTPGMGDGGQGAFARFIKSTENGLLRVPDGLSLRAAALAEPLAVALHGITNSKIEPGERALVLGAGPIGALTIAALKALGIDDVKVSEPSPLRQDLARRLGATVVIAPNELENPGPYDPGAVVSDAVDVVLECSGHGDAMEAGLAQLKRTGRLVLVGAGMATPRFDPNRILLNELVITGAFCYDADGFERSLALLASGKLPLDELIDPTDVPLTGALDAMRALASGRIAAKVLIAPGAQT